jgi:hypothetical protein
MPDTQRMDWRDASQRERLRRARLMSIFLLGGFVITLALTPEIFFPSFDFVELIVVGGALLLLVVCAVFNRVGYVAAAATIMIAGVGAAIAGSQYSYPGGLPLSGRTAFDLFVIPILLAGVLLPRRMSVIFLGVFSAFIFVDLQFGAKEADLTAFIAKEGIYTVVATPILLLSAVAVVAWVAAGSVRHALREADRTRELEQAYQFIAEQNLQLEAAIASIQQVHAQAAKGDLAVRAPVTSHALAPLAISLNLMLERLSHARGAEMAIGGLEQRVMRLEHVVSTLAAGYLRQVVPVQDLGRLTPLAQRIEELRVGMLNAIQATAQLAERALHAFHDYRAVVHEVANVQGGVHLDADQARKALQHEEQLTQQAISACIQYARQLGV